LIGLRNPGIVVRGAGEELGGKGKTLDADDFVSNSVNNGGEIERMGVVVE
jgi:hypothetical protein